MLFNIRYATTQASIEAISELGQNLSGRPSAALTRVIGSYIRHHRRAWRLRGAGQPGLVRYPGRNEDGEPLILRPYGSAGQEQSGNKCFMWILSVPRGARLCKRGWTD
jgi:hypothetical protein